MSAETPAAAATEENLLAPEEYDKKASELETRLSRIEGRTSKEKRLHDFFEKEDLAVTVTQMEKKGLGMVSRRPIATNTIVMTCPPYSCVPYETRKKWVCAYCFSDKVPPADTDVDKVCDGPDPVKQWRDPNYTGDAESPLLQCPGCKEVWYCNQECLDADRPEHGAYECQALANTDVPWAKDYYQYCDDLITDIRLLIRTTNKKKIQEAKGDPEFVLEYELLISNKDCYPRDVLESLRHVVQFANYVLPLDAQQNEEELLEIYCKHRVNMFGLWGTSGECLGYGVYPRASYYNHSCWPNTTFFKNTTHKIPHMDFQTVFDVEKAGEEICISYIDISGSLVSRRNTLLDKYFFHCTCDRCVFQEGHPDAPDPYHKYWVNGENPDYDDDDEEEAQAPVQTEIVEIPSPR